MSQGDGFDAVSPVENACFSPGLNNESLPPLGPSPFQDEPPALGGHSGAKPVVPLFFQVGRVGEIFFHRPAPVEIYELAFRSQKSLVVKTKLTIVPARATCPVGF